MSRCSKSLIRPDAGVLPDMPALGFAVRRFDFGRGFVAVLRAFDGGWAGQSFPGPGGEAQFLQRRRPAIVLRPESPLRVIDSLQRLARGKGGVRNEGRGAGLFPSELHVSPFLRPMHVNDALR